MPWSGVVGTHTGLRGDSGLSLRCLEPFLGACVQVVEVQEGLV